VPVHVRGGTAVVLLDGADGEGVLGGSAAVLELAAAEVPTEERTPSTRRATSCGRCGRTRPRGLSLVLVPETTAKEAQAVASLVASEGWDHVTVVTSSHHTARARLLFRQCLGDAVSVVGVPRPNGASLQSRLREVIGMLAGATIRRAC
jgi:hypothetical protein